MTEYGIIPRMSFETKTSCLMKKAWVKKLGRTVPLTTINVKTTTVPLNLSRDACVANCGGKANEAVGLTVPLCPTFPYQLEERQGRVCVPSWMPVMGLQFWAHLAHCHRRVLDTCRLRDSQQDRCLSIKKKISIANTTLNPIIHRDTSKSM
jgi:hypothetical protein